MLTTAMLQTTSRTSNKGVGVRVTKKVLDQVEKKGGTQACISIRGDGDSLKDYRGQVLVEFQGNTYTIMKGDSHVAWGTKQGDAQEDFVNLFNALAENPGEYQGTVSA